MQNYFSQFDFSIHFFIDKKELDRRYFELCRSLHPDHLMQAAPDIQADALQKIAEVNIAYKNLKNDDLRLQHILQLAGLLNASGTNVTELNLSPAFLMEMMEYNEQIDDSAPSPHLASEINGLDKQRQNAQKLLLQQYDTETVEENKPALLKQVLQLYLERKYLLRIINRLTNIAT